MRRGLIKISLPDFNRQEFEDFLLKGIDFDTGRPVENEIELPSDKGIENYIRLGNEKYFFSFYKEALSYYALVLKNNIQTIDAWVGQVRVLLDLGAYKSALYWSERGIEILAPNPLLESLKALCLVYTGDNTKAIGIINRPVSDSDPPMLWLIRGEIFIRLKRFRHIFSRRRDIGPLGAFFSFLKALEPNPRDGFMNQRIGIAYLQQHYLERSFEHLRLSLISAPQNPLTLYFLAEYYRQKKNYRYARFYAKKSIAFNPNLEVAIELLQFLHSPVIRLREKLRSVI